MTRSRLRKQVLSYSGESNIVSLRTHSRQVIAVKLDILNIGLLE
jgi:hypothetical protein